jgi:hypothetical protein
MHGSALQEQGEYAVVFDGERGGLRPPGEAIVGHGAFSTSRRTSESTTDYPRCGAQKQQ